MVARGALPGVISVGESRVLQRISLEEDDYGSIEDVCTLSMLFS